MLSGSYSMSCKRISLLGRLFIIEYIRIEYTVVKWALRRKIKGVRIEECRMWGWEVKHVRWKCGWDFDFFTHWITRAWADCSFFIFPLFDFVKRKDDLMLIFEYFLSIFTCLQMLFVDLCYIESRHTATFLNLKSATLVRYLAHQGKYSILKWQWKARIHCFASLLLPFFFFSFLFVISVLHKQWSDNKSHWLTTGGIAYIDGTIYPGCKLSTFLLMWPLYFIQVGLWKLIQTNRRPDHFKIWPSVDNPIDNNALSVKMKLGKLIMHRIISLN